MARSRSRLSWCVALQLLPSGQAAEACVCQYIPSVEEEYEASTEVFAGRVIEVSFDDAPTPNGGRQESLVATIEVIRLWKGEPARVMKVSTHGSREMTFSCSTDFQINAHFIVFAHGRPPRTTSCTNTREYAPVAEKGQWGDAEALVKVLDDVAARDSAR